MFNFLDFAIHFSVVLVEVPTDVADDERENGSIDEETVIVERLLVLLLVLRLRLLLMLLLLLLFLIINLLIHDANEK